MSRSDGLFLKLLWPVPDHPITSSAQDHLNRGQARAIDIACETGTPILAGHDGLIAYAGLLGDCGLAVDLQFEGCVVRHCHLISLAVQAPQEVTAGQVIGYAGSTGLSTGPHLHLAVWIDGMRVDPAVYLVEDSMDIERISAALGIIWGWATKRTGKKWTKQAELETTSAVIAVKEELGLP